MFSALRKLILVMFLAGPCLLYAHHPRVIGGNSKSATTNLADKNYKSVTYYIHPLLGNDNNSGLSKASAFKSVEKISKLNLHPGDSILLAADQVFTGSIRLQGQSGSHQYPIFLGSVQWDGKGSTMPATIDFKGRLAGILISDCSNWEIENIRLTADGYGLVNEDVDMRCAVLLQNEQAKEMENIRLQRLTIDKVFYENPGFIRSKEEVKSANGTQRYGWGIRIINKQRGTLIHNIEIDSCNITDVSHTGIKLTGSKYNIRDVRMIGNHLLRTGGPGIQMSEVHSVYVAGNVVDQSGCNDDSRKWGRGSGLWTWGSSHVLIEKNQFRNANGPGDSAGAHIDFNCDNVVIQYNLSMHNAGGFFEILGNNYNCAYRYNISVNGGYRIKGEKGAFQEGKTIWLSGYVGNIRPKKGPVNTYIYNNTIFCDASIEPKIAIESSSSGILIANNIFYLHRPLKWVAGDQEKRESASVAPAKNVMITNNLFYQKDTWPAAVNYENYHPQYGDPGFSWPQANVWKAFMPAHKALVSMQGLIITRIPGDTSGLLGSVHLKYDILGNPIADLPAFGAIEP
jgi:hypothetical protein